jgi:hypothetical protein
MRMDDDVSIVALNGSSASRGGDEREADALA